MKKEILIGGVLLCLILYSFKVLAQTPPTANFTVDDQSPCIGKTIQFTNLSENATSYKWIFKRGIPAESTDENPQVFYEGQWLDQYDVTLIAFNDLGSDTLTYQNYISTSDPGFGVKVDYEIEDCDCQSESVKYTFTATVTGVEPTDSLSYSWGESNVYERHHTIVGNPSLLPDFLTVRNHTTGCSIETMYEYWEKRCPTHTLITQQEIGFPCVAKYVCQNQDICYDIQPSYPDHLFSISFDYDNSTLGASTFLATIVADPCTYELEFPIYVIEAPKIEANLTQVCVGQKVDLFHISDFDDGTIRWLIDNVQDTTTNTPSLSMHFDKAGSYSIKTQSRGDSIICESYWCAPPFSGCLSEPIIIEVVESNLNTITLDYPNQICQNDTLNLQANTTNTPSSFQWILDGDTLDFDQKNIALMDLAIGNHQFTVSADCNITAEGSFIVEECFGLANENLHLEPFKILTTPEALILVQSEKPLQNSTLTLYDLNGRLVQQVKNGSNQEIQMDIAHLSTGIYIYRVRSDNERIANGKVWIK